MTHEYLIISFNYCIILFITECIVRSGVRDEDRFKNIIGGFPGGTVVKNPPANAGDTCLSPGPGRSHMLWSNKACAPQLLSLHSRAREPQLLSLRATITDAHAPQQEKPPQ